MTLYVAPIVEGATEENCIKVILARIWRELLQVPDAEPLAVLEPLPTPRTSFVRDQHPELGQVVERAARRLRERMRQPAGSRGLILALLDADEDCPAQLGSTLQLRAKAARPDHDIACVLAKRELENWFKAAASSLAGVCGLPADLAVPADPENGSGDTWLTRQMKSVNRQQQYKKPADAEELARRMDLQLCRANSPSFQKLCRELEGRVLLPPANAPESTDATPPG